jgi:hypothetical protein
MMPKPRCLHKNRLAGHAGRGCAGFRLRVPHALRCARDTQEDTHLLDYLKNILRPPEQKASRRAHDRHREWRARALDVERA